MGGRHGSNLRQGGTADQSVAESRCHPSRNHYGVGLPHMPQQKLRGTSETLVDWSRGAASSSPR
jgi:hypothetical protein